MRPGPPRRSEWKARRLDPWREAFPRWRPTGTGPGRGRLREGWREALPSFKAGEQIATRSAGQKTMAAFAEFAPTMIGGAADLVESTKTVFEGAGEFSRVHAGTQRPVRHSRARDGGDRQRRRGARRDRQAVRLDVPDLLRLHAPQRAAVGADGLPVVWVWTHDSVGLGEDGPTHQPIEHYAALRAIPHLWVIRPADANETSVAWRVALEREDGPVALLLSRQNIPVLDREELASAEQLERGGYVLWDSSADGASADGTGPEALAGTDPDVILISTGAEVPPTLQAGPDARRGGRERARRVDALHGAVRSPAAGVPRAGAPPRGDGPPGGRAGREHELVEVGGHRGRRARARPFGASAPGTTVLEKLGFTAENIASRARALLGHSSPTLH